VHARSITLMARPGSIDAGVAFVRDEVMPALLGMDGFVGLSMLVDRSSGRCITTSAWRTPEAMRDSEERIRPLRERAAQLMGGEPAVAHWEIAVLHRDHASRPGACVRATWVRIDPSRVDRLLDVYRMGLLPQIEQYAGFCSASMLVDRASGRAVSSVTFDDARAMERTRDQAETLRQRGAQETGGEIAEVGEFELALAHLRVPEMA